MSEPARYGRKGGDLEPLKDGQYVTYSDYAALQAENERLKELVESNLNIGKKVLGQSDALRIERDSLAAENERLRKAGDALFESVKYHRINSLIDDRSEVAWLAAKEGRDAK